MHKPTSIASTVWMTPAVNVCDTTANFDRTIWVKPIQYCVAPHATGTAQKSAYTYTVQGQHPPATILCHTLIKLDKNLWGA